MSSYIVNVAHKREQRFFCFDDAVEYAGEQSGDTDSADITITETTSTTLPYLEALKKFPSAAAPEPETPQLSINFEIHLPANAPEELVESVFQQMEKHLYSRKEPT